jgi:glucose dehydrogenase
MRFNAGNSSRHAWLALTMMASFSAAAAEQPDASPTQPSLAKGEWFYWSGDLRGHRYSPADQINADNFNKLELVWRLKTDNFGTRPEYKLEGTPLAVDGVLYTTAGTRRDVVALDAATGEIRWMYSMREGQRAVNSPRQLSGHGVSYWTDGKGDDRILFVTTGYRLVELNARNGREIESFGKAGVIDLKLGLITGTGRQIDLETGDAGLHSTALVVKDIVVVGIAMSEGHTPRTHDNTKGAVRGFDVRTGKLLWTFNTVPRPGEFGNDTWENGSWATNGNTGVWTQMSADPQLGLIYLPVEDPTSDYYGGHRPGDNLFGDSLVCLDVTTGKRKWHYQVVHHPIWNYDLSSAPIIADIHVGGKDIKAVALPSKEAFLYVFDRVTGQPIWPFAERPVQQSDVPGEKTSPTQPIPSNPPPYARNEVRLPEDLIDFTPEMRKQAMEIVAKYRVAGMFNPALIGRPDGLYGAINLGNGNGGTNWQGAGYDPETHVVYGQAMTAGIQAVSLRTPPPGLSDMRYVSGRNDLPFFEPQGAGAGTAADVPVASKEAAMKAGQTGQGGGPNLLVDGLPLLKPPYGVVWAVDLDRGELKWQVPFGQTPDYIRNHAKLKELNIGNTGQPGAVSVLVTKTLLIVGDAQITAADHPRGSMLRAYDKASGKEVGAVWMPGPQSGGPMTYLWRGKQYIIVAISGGSYSGEYLAFALPAAD